MKYLEGGTGRGDVGLLKEGGERMLDIYAGESIPAERPRTSEPTIQSKADAKLILRIATQIEDFVSANGWSWCDMDRVYRVLKGIHG